MKQVLQLLETIAAGVEFSSSRPAKVPSAPRVPTEDARPVSTKMRHILASAGLLSTLSSLITIGESSAMDRLLMAVKKALKLLETFVGELWSNDA